MTPPSTPPPSTVAACVVPPNTVENQNANCAAGNCGTIAQTRFATWSCPEAWDAPVMGSFGTWTTTSNTCTACPSPTTQTQNQWVATPSSCAAAQYGTRSWEREQSQSRTVSYNCPAGTTTLPAPSYSSWGAWADTGVTRNQVNTCTNCPAPSTQTQTRWVASSAACPAGYTGSHTWEREQSSTRSVSYSCPAGTTTLPPATFGSWSAWANTGATRNVVNTCTAPPPSASFVSGCDFSGPYGRTSFESPHCAWDPSAYWQSSATVMVGNMFDAQGRPYLDDSLYRVEMTSTWDGANCAASACVIYMNMSTGDGRGITRVRVYRRSDNALMHDEMVEADFSNL